MMNNQIKYRYILDFKNIIRSKSGRYMWKQSIGATVPFNYNNGQFVGELKIVDYKNPHDLESAYIYFEYEGHKLKPITVKTLRNGILSCLFGDEKYWNCSLNEDKSKASRKSNLYQIGDVIKQNNNIRIIDKKDFETKNGVQTKYKIYCSLCGFDSGKYYIADKLYNEYWISEYNIKQLKKCPCCSNRIIVSGINDFNTINPELTQYLVIKEKGSKLSKWSKTPIVVKCPDCGSMKISSPATLTNRGHLSCRCKDHVSLPNKISNILFEELLKSGYIDDFIYEYSPKWASRYSYDNYFVFKGLEYIVEMDGGIGHGKMTYDGKHDIDGKIRDEIKDHLARKHNIIMIRIDCDKCNFIKIKNAILDSVLSKIIDFSKIDWDIIKKKTFINRHKLICSDYKDNKLSIQDLSNQYNYTREGIINILKKGTKYGWCEYHT